MSKKLLEEEFDKDLKKLIEEVVKHVYKPTKLIQMCERDGYFKTAKNLAKDLNGSSGFMKLFEVNRTDISIENLVIQPKYKSLFDKDIIKICKQKLEIKE